MTLLKRGLSRRRVLQTGMAGIIGSGVAPFDMQANLRGSGEGQINSAFNQLLGTALGDLRPDLVGDLVERVGEASAEGEGGRHGDG